MMMMILGAAVFSSCAPLVVTAADAPRRLVLFGTTTWAAVAALERFEHTTETFGTHRRLHLLTMPWKRRRQEQQEQQPSSPSARAMNTNDNVGDDDANTTVIDSSSLDTGSSSSTSSSLPPPETTPSLLQKFFAECFGTFLLVFLGTGSLLSANVGNGVSGLPAIAAVWSIAVVLAICATESISGAHLNPAITWALAWIRPGSPDRDWKLVRTYVVAQLTGAVLGSGTNLLLYGSKLKAFEATNGIVRSASDPAALTMSSSSPLVTAQCFGDYFHAPLTTLQAFAVETVATAVLAAVVFALTHPKKQAALAHAASQDGSWDPPVPLLIGATIFALICAVGPLTQAGMNPTRDFGPRLVAYFVGGWSARVAFAKAWVYLLAPLVGAPLGGWLVDHVLYREYDGGTEAQA